MPLPDIFISYAREDEAWVRPLVAELERRGCSVFWDRRVPAGKTWRTHIGAALEQARCVVVVWSEHSIVSKFVLEEADEGKQRDVLVPISRQPLRPPFGFREIHAANLSSWRPGLPSEEFAAFLDDLSGMLGPPQQAELSGTELLESIAPVVGTTLVQASPKFEASERDEGLPNASQSASASPSADATSTSRFGQVETGLASPSSKDSFSAAHSAPQLTAFDHPTRHKDDPAPSPVQPESNALKLAALALITVGIVGGGVYTFTQLSTEPTTATVEAKPAITSPAVESAGPLLATEPTSTSLISSANSPLISTRQTFTDTLVDGTACPFCPEMVVIPVGSFTMGSPSSEAGRDDDEGPQRKVTIAQPFALGRYEVTFAQWDVCVAAAACNKFRPDDRGWGRGSQPVINVSWQDARGFVTWLNRKTGQPYRLPTEAEWEYAARAGTTSPFWTGSTISTAQANYDGNYTYGAGAKGIYRARTVAVDDPSFPANPFGLSHMHGNVWEWVQDCYRSNYDEVPIDGSKSVEAANCPGRVLRGGSWGNMPRLLRSADRGTKTPIASDNYIGFRVARAMPE